jgi:hypothetical protein
MNLELIFDPREADAIPSADVALAEVRPEEPRQAATLWDSFPGLMPFA